MAAVIPANLRFIVRTRIDHSADVAPQHKSYARIGCRIANTLNLK
ncbi:hypothetical protein U91I_02050 [alpha proteobacterium U9-1i]|nr:hypothetical protein U91I_02050 [alpha proteobacterium U9-1i]